jgi:hypothetical protein
MLLASSLGTGPLISCLGFEDEPYHQSASLLAPGAINVSTVLTVLLNNVILFCNSLLFAPVLLSSAVRRGSDEDPELDGGTTKLLFSGE